MKRYTIEIKQGHKATDAEFVKFIDSLMWMKSVSAPANGCLDAPWYCIRLSTEEPKLTFKDLKPGDKFIFCDAKHTMDQPDIFLMLTAGGCALIETGHVMGLLDDNQLLEREVELKEK